MKILITGSTGLLGQALGGHLAALGDVTGVSRRPPASRGGSAHVACDLRDAGRVAALVSRLQPDAVIHSQAMSDVDQCERDPGLARAMNAKTTANLVRALGGAPAVLLYVSTDYVFDGEKGQPYNEQDAPRPISVYGQSKLEGEREALRHPRAVVVRPSTLFGPGRMNFCDAIVRALQEGRTIEAFVDQTTSPTYTEDLAEMMKELIVVLTQSGPAPTPNSVTGATSQATRLVWGRASRIVHMSNAGGASRVAFAHRIADLLGRSREAVRPIRMADQRRPAKRPAYSALTSAELVPLTGRMMRPWDDALHAYLRQRGWLG
ncbi:MAG: dTDP-4-dehydrorhamnose reductase [Candidatus Omnitrophica bacterium]|nr:dTDP-4-dehydrorhamnose reductase [Candidatus Omnitrophota bacterium]